MAFNKYLCESNINLLEHSISKCTKPIIDSGNLTCIECQTNYIPKDNSKECIALSTDSSYQNCDLLDSTPTTNKTADGTSIYPCKICNSEYIFSSRGTCDIKKITNCEEHNLSTGKCIKCNEGFLLSFDECVTIPSNELCVKYDNNKNCLQCKQDYELVIIETSGEGDQQNQISVKSECIVTGFKNNCVNGKNRIYLDNTTQTYKEECTECLGGYVLVEDDGSVNGDDYSKCYPTPYKDDNCKEYSTTTLMCKTCKEGYYGGTKNKINVCLEIEPVPNCTGYIENTNTCNACENNYFLNLDPRECIKNPEGIQNCLKYKSENECSVCADKYYLSENKCESVPEDNLVTDCTAYKSATECQTCVTNKVPNTAGTECESITENSCSTWKDASNCETCPDGKILKDEGGKKVCGDFSIDNCATVNTKDLTCDACSPGYYKTGSTTCTETSTTISKCLIYESAELCGECEPTYMLNHTKSECIGMGTLSGIPISNCSTGHEIAPVEEGKTDPGFCYECNNGFLKVDGKCSACGVSKCRYCNPSDKNECMVCLSGYFMSEEGKCKSNTGDDDVDPVTPPVDPISVEIRSVLSILFIISFLFLSK